MGFPIARAAALATVLLPISVGLAAQVPSPRPFPGSSPGTSSPSRPSSPAPSTPAEPSRPQPAPPPVAAPPVSPAAATPGPPAASGAGEIGNVPMYPGAEFLDSYDAGRGQRYVLFGSDAPFDTVVAFYKQELRNGGRDILPGMRQFDLGDFKSDRMAYPPSVVVKNYAASEPSGYLFVKGSVEKRYPTVIQVVPVPAAAAAR